MFLSLRASSQCTYLSLLSLFDLLSFPLNPSFPFFPRRGAISPAGVGHPELEEQVSFGRKKLKICNLGLSSFQSRWLWPSLPRMRYVTQSHKLKVLEQAWCSRPKGESVRRRPPPPSPAHVGTTQHPRAEVGQGGVAVVVPEYFESDRPAWLLQQGRSRVHVPRQAKLQAGAARADSTSS